MSLRAALSKAVDKAFAATDDIPESITLRVSSGGTYNPVTGLNPTEVDYEPLTAVVIKPTAQDLTDAGLDQPADGVEGEYTTFLINRNDLVSLGFTGKIEVNHVIIYQGNPYTVKKPADIFGFLFKVIGLRGSDGT